MAGQWAADPHGRHELRYWDGEVWTDHVSDGGVTSIESPDSVPAPGTPYPDQHPPQYPGQQYPAAQPAVGYGTKKKADGKMMAAGVMSIVAAAIGLMMGLWLFSLTTSEVGGWADDLTGGSITFAAFLILAISGAWLYVGIATCKANDWARITVLVGNLILGAIVIFGALSGTEETTQRNTDTSFGFNNTVTTTESDSPGAGELVLPIAWFGSIVFLAATGKVVDSPG